jgi:hypothetical protein
VLKGGTQLAPHGACTRVHALCHLLWKPGQEVAGGLCCSSSYDMRITVKLGSDITLLAMQWPAHVYLGSDRGGRTRRTPPKRTGTRRQDRSATVRQKPAAHDLQTWWSHKNVTTVSHGKCAQPYENESLVFSTNHRSFVSSAPVGRAGLMRRCQSAHRAGKRK